MRISSVLSLLFNFYINFAGLEWKGKEGRVTYTKIVNIAVLPLSDVFMQLYCFSGGGGTLMHFLACLIIATPTYCSFILLLIIAFIKKRDHIYING